MAYFLSTISIKAKDMVIEITRLNVLARDLNCGVV